jgi:hypothetical protein
MNKKEAMVKPVVTSARLLNAAKMIDTRRIDIAYTSTAGSDLDDRLDLLQIPL